MFGRLARWLKRYRFEVLLVTPTAVYVFGLTLMPVIRAISFGLTTEDGTLTLEHYRSLIADGRFQEALTNTILIVLIGLSLELAAGLALAWFLTHNFRLRGLFRSLFLVPIGVPTLVSAVNLMYVFDTSGYLNELLLKLGLIDLPIDWAAGGFRTIMMIVVTDMWKVTPMVMLILLAGLEAIPEQLYEAAAVDGATRWQTFWRITIPLLMPSITTAVVVRGIDTFRIFELPLILAGRNSPVLATLAYDQYILYGNAHTSGAAATFLLLLVVIFAVAYLRMAKEAEAA